MPQKNTEDEQVGITQRSTQYWTRDSRVNSLYPSDRQTPPDLGVYTPAMPPLRLMTTLRSRVLAWRRRRWIHQLLTYDDRTLIGLGFRRTDLAWAARLPTTVDATEAMRQLHSGEMNPMDYIANQTK